MRSIQLYILFFFTLHSIHLQAQNVKRFNTFQYSINEGLLQSHVHDMIFDKYGFGWLSFSNGLQKFNGKNFENIYIQDGLPEDKNLNFARDSNGEIYFLTTGTISWYHADKNKFYKIFQLQTSQINYTYFLGEVNHILYFFFANKTIIGIERSSHQKVFEQNFTAIPQFSDANIHSVVAKDKIIFNYGVNLFSLTPGKNSISTVPFNNSISLYNNFNLSKDGASILGFKKVSQEFHLNKINLISGANKLYTPIQPIDNRLERLSIYTSKKFHLISIYNEIYEMDEDFETIKYKWLNFQNSSCAGESLIDKIVEDQFGNIYLLTLNDGFRKIIHNNFPIKYYGTPKKVQNNIISLLPVKEENTILAGTFGNGLLVFDTLQRLKFHLKKLPNGETDISISNIINIAPHHYLLLQFHRNNAWIFNSSTYQIQPAPVKITFNFGFYGKTLLTDKSMALVQFEDAFYKIFKGSTLKIQENILKVSYSFVGATLYKNELLIGNNQFLEFYDTSNFTLRKKIPNTLNGGIRCIAIDPQNNIYLGCDKGLVKIDSSGNTIWKLEKKDGLPDDCIYSIQQDAHNDFWCSTNKGIFKLTTDKKIVVLRKEDGLQENEFNTNVSYKTTDGELYFGGVNGISAFNPNQISTNRENLQLLVTDIKIDGEPYFKDTAVWNLSSITLPYYQNNISINFTAFGAGNPDQYVYQYKMENVDVTWTLDNLNGSARYTLQPGTYEFKMFASKSFDKNAKPLKVIRIKITAPFWKKIWFWIIAGLLVLGIIAFNINLYTKRKFAKKIIQLKEQQKIQEERERISKELHDNIGVQANAILHNATLLNDQHSNKEQLAGNLKETAKLMLVNLRETLWAMKSNDITAIELWLRIISFMKQMGRNYADIQFTIEGQAPEHKTIGSNKALHIVLVLQEAVNNAVKHAKAKQITMSSAINNHQWIIVLQDDGKGFTLDLATLKTDHYGISNMQQRAIDGKFEFKLASTPDAGTRITVIQEL